MYNQARSRARPSCRRKVASGLWTSLHLFINSPGEWFSCCFRIIVLTCPFPCPISFLSFSPCCVSLFNLVFVSIWLILAHVRRIIIHTIGVLHQNLFLRARLLRDFFFFLFLLAAAKVDPYIYI